MVPNNVIRVGPMRVRSVFVEGQEGLDALALSIDHYIQTLGFLRNVDSEVGLSFGVTLLHSFRVDY